MGFDYLLVSRIMEETKEFYLRWDLTIEPEIRKCELKRKVVGVERPEAKNFLVSIFPHIPSDPKYGWHEDIEDLVLSFVYNTQDIASIDRLFWF